MARIEIQDVSKSFGPINVLHSMSLSIGDGEFVVLVGPSGCGKSTLLRAIAGLEPVTSGNILIADLDVTDLPAKHRDVAMVFQSYALYPHMNVAQNMGFSLMVRRVDRQEIDRRVKAAAEALDLTPLLDRKPAALSGGQRQRVAMGRAIVRDPKVFLFDEPLSNLDAKLRVAMRAEIKGLHQRLKTTTVYVTHDQVEAMTMADRIVVMRGGRIEQIGSPLDLYDRPTNIFVAQFIGSPAMNLLPARIERDGAAAVARIAGGAALPLPQSSPLQHGTDITLGVRPEHIQLSNAANGLPARVDLVEPLGAQVQLGTTVAKQNVTVLLNERLLPPIGSDLALTVLPENLHIFDAGSGVRL